MRRNIFYMMVGIPASGKSAEAKKLFAVVRSSDDLREKLLGDINEQGYNMLIFDLLHSLIKADLYNGLDTVLDATNLNSQRRRELLKALRLLPCKKVCIYMKTPYTVCMARNCDRERSVPVEVMERMNDNLQEPIMAEGWDEIRVIECKEA